MKSALTRLGLFLFFIGVFLASVGSVKAATCGDSFSYNDPYNPSQQASVPTYCSISCGGNAIMSNYDGCPTASYCCASTTQECGGCLYGRRTYCAVEGGGNAMLPEFHCSSAASRCYLGAADAACPAVDPSTGGANGRRCGVGLDGGKVTFCSAICGNGSQQASSAVDNTCGAGEYCCTSNAENNPGNTTQAQLDAFNFCQQAPDGPQRQACIACVGNGGRQAQEKIYTAFGCIGTGGKALTYDLVTLLIGISGGVALLSILASAFVFATSQGDVSKTKKAKEMMTASVMGLLFIIFSVMILDFIGVKILQIPGLGSGTGV